MYIILNEAKSERIIKEDRMGEAPFIVLQWLSRDSCGVHLRHTLCRSYFFLKCPKLRKYPTHRSFVVQVNNASLLSQLPLHELKKECKIRSALQWALWTEAFLHWGTIGKSFLLLGKRTFHSLKVNWILNRYMLVLFLAASAALIWNQNARSLHISL